MARISTRKRGDTWYYSIEATEYALGGKRRRVEKGGFATQREAEDAGVLAKASLAKGNIAMLSEKCTLAEFLEEWLAVKAGEVRPNTSKNHRAYLAPVLDALGGRELQKIRPRDVNALVLELAKKGYSHGTLAKILGTLKSAFGYAVFPMELIAANPALCIKVPKNAPRGIVKRHIIRKEKLDELLAAFPFGHPMHMPIQIAYHTGMRVGEVLGLCWDAVDVDAGTVEVKRQIIYTPATGDMIGPPKTKSSVRTIPIDGDLLALLRRWKAAQAKTELAAGKSYLYAYEDTEGRLWHISKGQQPGEGMVRLALVCTGKQGHAASERTLRYHLAKHGLNSHSFRHTHATLCAEAGAPAKGLAARLGHSSTALTQDLYTHETERMRRETLDAFEAAKK